MTIKTTGALSTADIVAEFGDTTTPAHSISEFYAGGANVPAGTVGFPGGVSTAIPSSGTISWSNFYGAMKSVGLGNALRFRRSATAFLSRTVTTPSNRKTFTWSGWVKRSSLDVAHEIFGASVGSDQSALVFESGNDLTAFSANATATLLRTSNVFRDPSAWYHIVWAEDTTQATASERSKLYVNGVQMGNFTNQNFPPQNYEGAINNTPKHYISSYDGSNWLLEGYMAAITFVDGKALAPSDFGEFKDGLWTAKKYAGDVGTNGYILDFSKGAVPADFGKDSSGKGNDWNVNGFDATDWVKDVPSLTKDDTANYATLNPLLGGSGYTIANANLSFERTGGSGGPSDRSGYGTIGVTSGKWYWEVTSGATHSSGLPGYGISSTHNPNIWGGQDPNSYIYSSDGQKSVNGTTSSFGTTFVLNDVIGVAFDADTGTLDVYKNGVKQGASSLATGLTAGPYFPVITRSVGGGGINGVETANFGQQPFKNAPPAGFKPLNTFNLPAPAIKNPGDHFKAITYAGNDAKGRNIDLGFQPDLVWSKCRSSGFGHKIYDSVRGPLLQINTNSDSPESPAPGQLTAFGTNGFTLGDDQGVNQSGQQYVAWCWKAGGTPVANTDGTIASQVSVNKEAGFSIVTYTSPNNTANQTVGHGLGVKPNVIIVKDRDGTRNWDIYHSSLGYNSSLIFTTAGTRSNAFGNAEPTSTVFSTTDNYTHSGADKYVAYCWAEVPGFSKFGSYIGNGDNNGTFVYTGFRPAFVLIKKVDTASWILLDSSRSPYNPCDDVLYPNSGSSEGTNDSNHAKDFLSNGFKMRSGHGDDNGGGSKYIYMAFAEHPFKYANAR